jgi:glycosyltransferase involved in cell wall biosynthesis
VNNHRWISCQLGAREHYAVPRALHRSGCLERLITDMWVHPGSLLAGLKHELRGRFHPSLADANVCASNKSALAFATLAYLRGLSGWKLIRERNEWFQRRAVGELAHYERKGKPGSFTLFSYSYAARRLLEFARELGWQTVLEQIDPGPLHERTVARVYEENSAYGCDWQPAPSEYWTDWRKECELADYIVVNSTWSQEGLIQEGVAEDKIRVLPLAFEMPVEAESFVRRYPAVFTAQRRLRVLFLGQINLGKGVAPLLDAVKLLQGERVEFWFVGPIWVTLPEKLKQHPQLHWIGAVARNEVARYYRDADVFIFPTFSDGFGLTQLEAQAWKLPLVSSRFCGNVVRDNVNGIILDDLSGIGIATVLRKFLGNPGMLREMSAKSGVDNIFRVESLASALLNL